MPFRPTTSLQRLARVRGLTSGGAAPALLNPLSGGTFTRSTEASYLTSPSTIAWAAVDERRNEFGSLLYEGSRTNLLLRSEEFGDAAWTASSLTVTANTDTAPDGDVDADSLAFTASASASISQPFASTPADAATAVCTVWLRAAAPQTVRLRLRQKDGATFGSDVSCSVTTTWQRFELKQAVGSGASAPALFIQNHTDAAARTISAWGAQVECSAATIQFPSSYIRTAGTTVTRAADALTYADGQYNAALLTSGFRVMYMPLGSSAELTTAAVSQTLLGFGGGNTETVIVSFTGANAQVYLQKGGDRLLTNASWSRLQALSLTVRPTANSAVLSGYSTGDGTYAAGGAFSFSTGTMRIGARVVAGDINFFGRIGSLVSP